MVVVEGAEAQSDAGETDGNASFLRAARAGNLEKVIEYLKGSIDINTSNAQNGLNALHLASKEGHVHVVTELLKRGANGNAATKKGNTALHIASLAGQEEVVKILVQNGANVNVQSQNGFTPLYMAAQENHDSVVRYLLSNGANQSLATEDGFTPLAVALQQGHDKVVAVLLENDTKGRVRLPALHIAAKKDDCKAAALLLQNDHNPDVTSKSGFTPLHIAAHYGNENIANLLLDKGADVNYAAKHQITPLHVASKWGKTNMVTLLLERGAKIEASTRDGLTPLHCAARSGHDQVVDLLLEKGAPIVAKTKNGLAPLHMASQGDHVDSARILLYHKAPVDDVTVDYLTALHVAAHCGHVRVAKLLLDRKADPNARALNGFTPLHIACKKNRIKVVELLLKHGGSIEATTESGLTPLHVASFMGCMNIVIFLIQHGASPDVPTVRGETPLHLAARANQTDIIRILLRNGAHVDARAREDQTPLHIASRLGNVDIVSLLLQHGAAVDSTTKDLYTPLHIAAKEGQEEVASVLLDHGASLTSTTKKGFTPLHLAAKYGNIKVARLLLQKDAPVDAQGKNGVTPLHVAAHYDHVNVALLLLEKGASPHAMSKNGYTPLHIAAKKNQMDIATTLLEYGAKPDAESKAGFTPLHLGSQEGHTDVTTLLIEHNANVNAKAKNGLTPLHLCSQEDHVKVAAILVKSGAEIGPQTKAGYTPLHVASHFGQINMVRFLLQHAADVNMTTSHGYTPLHQAAQQGHTLIINLLLDHKASPNVTTTQGQTALSIAQRLGYISVVETLKVVTETIVTTTTTTVTEEKYKVVAPETMQETFMTDSEDEGGEDIMLGEQSYRYLTADEMKFLGDDSLPIDVTKDEKNPDAVSLHKDFAAPLMVEEEQLSPQHISQLESSFSEKYSPDNVDISHAPVHAGFLVSFMVDARGGAMRGCRHSGVRVIIPPRKAPMPMRITCRYLRKEKLIHPPPLMEGEACASRILEVGPVNARFLGPVIIEVPHFASLRGKEREITILRSDNGESWREHTLEASEEAVQEVLNESFEGEEFTALEDLNTNRITRILTTDFPQYFALITRVRQEVHAVGPEGGMVSSTVVPQVQAIFPEGALTKKIKVGLQAQPISPELVAKLLGNRVAVSPIVTVEPRRRKFHKPITLTIPVPQAATKGMINQYSGDAPTLRLLCSITGGTTKAQWEDVTGSTPLTFVNECVSFTTTVSARFWLMDCRQVNEATKFATELYQEAIHVPFMAKFVVFAKRHDPMEAQLRVFCMTDDKEDKTLESQEHFTEVAKSRDIEVLEGKLQYLEFAGNLVPVTKSGEQLKLTFQAFRENRLPFIIRVKDLHQEPMGRIAFMREPRVGRGEPPQTPICNLNVALPEVCPISDVAAPLSELVTLERKYGFVQEAGLAKPELIHRADLRLSDIARELDKDWVALALQLDISEGDIMSIKAECPVDISEQALIMLRLWMQRSGSRGTGNELEKALRKIGREDIVNSCMFNVELVTDDVEKAVAKVHLDQSGFDVFKEELGSSREASIRRGASLDVSYDEQDIMKEAESAAETSSETGSVFEKENQLIIQERETSPLHIEQKSEELLYMNGMLEENVINKINHDQSIKGLVNHVQQEDTREFNTSTSPKITADKKASESESLITKDQKEIYYDALEEKENNFNILTVNPSCSETAEKGSNNIQINEETVNNDKNIFQNVSTAKTVCQGIPYHLKEKDHVKMSESNSNQVDSLMPTYEVNEKLSASLAEQVHLFEGNEKYIDIESLSDNKEASPKIVSKQHNISEVSKGIETHLPLTHEIKPKPGFHVMPNDKFLAEDLQSVEPECQPPHAVAKCTPEVPSQDEIEQTLIPSNGNTPNIERTNFMDCYTENNIPPAAVYMEKNDLAVEFVGSENDISELPPFSVLNEDSENEKDNSFTLEVKQFMEIGPEKLQYNISEVSKEVEPQLSLTCETEPKPILQEMPTDTVNEFETMTGEESKLQFALQEINKESLVTETKNSMEGKSENIDSNVNPIMFAAPPINSASEVESPLYGETENKTDEGNPDQQITCESVAEHTVSLKNGLESSDSMVGIISTYTTNIQHVKFDTFETAVMESTSSQFLHSMTHEKIEPDVDQLHSLISELQMNTEQNFCESAKSSENQIAKAEIEDIAFDITRQNTTASQEPKAYNELVSTEVKDSVPNQGQDKSIICSTQTSGNHNVTLPTKLDEISSEITKIQSFECQLEKMLPEVQGILPLSDISEIDGNSPEVLSTNTMILPETNQEMNLESNEEFIISKSNLTSSSAKGKMFGNISNGTPAEITTSEFKANPNEFECLYPAEVNTCNITSNMGFLKDNVETDYEKTTQFLINNEHVPAVDNMKDIEQTVFVPCEGKSSEIYQNKIKECHSELKVTNPEDYVNETCSSQIAEYEDQNTQNFVHMEEESTTDNSIKSEGIILATKEKSVERHDKEFTTSSEFVKFHEQTSDLQMLSNGIQTFDHENSQLVSDVIHSKSEHDENSGVEEISCDALFSLQLSDNESEDCTLSIDQTSQTQVLCNKIDAVDCENFKFDKTSFNKCDVHSETIEKIVDSYSLIKDIEDKNYNLSLVQYEDPNKELYISASQATTNKTEDEKELQWLSITKCEGENTTVHSEPSSLSLVTPEEIHPNEHINQAVFQQDSKCEEVKTTFSSLKIDNTNDNEANGIPLDVSTIDNTSQNILESHSLSFDGNDKYEVDKEVVLFTLDDKCKTIHPVFHSDCASAKTCGYDEQSSSNKHCLKEVQFNTSDKENKTSNEIYLHNDMCVCNEQNAQEEDIQFASQVKTKLTDSNILKNFVDSSHCKLHESTKHYAEFADVLCNKTQMDTLNFAESSQTNYLESEAYVAGNKTSDSEFRIGLDNTKDKNIEKTEVFEEIIIPKNICSSLSSSKVAVLNRQPLIQKIAEVLQKDATTVSLVDKKYEADAVSEKSENLQEIKEAEEKPVQKEQVATTIETKEVADDGVAKRLIVVTKTVIQETEDIPQEPREQAKLTESETWLSGEMDTSQVSVSSLPDDEKSEPTTATVSSTTAEPEVAPFVEQEVTEVCTDEKEWSATGEEGSTHHVIHRTTHVALTVKEKSGETPEGGVPGFPQTLSTEHVEYDEKISSISSASSDLALREDSDKDIISQDGEYSSRTAEDAHYNGFDSSISRTATITRVVSSVTTTLPDDHSPEVSVSSAVCESEELSDSLRESMQQVLDQFMVDEGRQDHKLQHRKE